MTDRELLEAAGKAFGLALPLLRDTSKQWRGWNPLEDDAEAFIGPTYYEIKGQFDQLADENNKKLKTTKSQNFLTVAPRFA